MVDGVQMRIRSSDKRMIFAHPRNLANLAQVPAPYDNQVSLELLNFLQDTTDLADTNTDKSVNINTVRSPSFPRDPGNQGFYQYIPGKATV